MPTRYTRDTFDSFRVLPWEIDGATVRLHYALDDALHFTETLTLPVEVHDIDAVRGIVDLLAVAAGTSYFKVAAPQRALVDCGPLSSAGRAVARALYDDGLREFATVNGLDVPLVTDLHAPEGTPVFPLPASDRPLVPCGGGRDSTLLASVLADRSPYLVSIKANPYVDRLGAMWGLEVGRVQRTIDRQLVELNAGPAMNGHVPVTAINGLISVLTAAATGCGAVAMANERSASVPSRILADGTPVNHQYSKSVEFEGLLRAALGDGVNWFSALRPWSELAIARAVAHRHLVPHIMSCNRAFTVHRTASTGWCRECDKCRFVFLTLAPFCPRDELVAAFGGDLLADGSPANIDGFDELCQEQRPFDCVGEADEARAAVTLLADGVWSRHPVVHTLLTRYGRLPEARVHELLEPAGDHHVPAAYLDLLTPVLA